MLRRAEERDARDIARIYNQAIRPGVYATGQSSQVSDQERIEWLKRHQDPYPVWVWETDAGEVVAWCSLSPFPVRNYSSVAESSRYVDEAIRSHGIGTKMTQHLITEGRLLGFRSLISIVYEKNLPSILTTLRNGYRPSAVLVEQAHSQGDWETVIWLQKDLINDDA